MSQQIALFLCILFILYLFRMDFNRKHHFSLTLWVPFLYLTIYCTRPLSVWLNIGNETNSSDYYLEGSPFDRNIYIVFIIISIIILLRRRFVLTDFIKDNKIIFIYIVYLGLSALWSEFPVVSFKRWIKEIGNIIIILIVLTDHKPLEAMKTIFKRCAYVLVPLSIIFNKYFPELGRTYSIGGGDPMYVGVTTHKNSLGILCLVCGVILFWNLRVMYSNRKEYIDKKEVYINVLILLMISYLLYMANSMTSLVGTILGVFLIVSLGLPSIKKNIKMIKYIFIFLVIIFVIMSLSFNVFDIATSTLGRDSTLTGRTEFWEELIKVDTNPLIGTGYESFWLGERIKKFWDIYWWHPNQAHNGYLEIYLNLGFIGLILLMGLFYFVYRDINKKLLLFYDYDYQILRLTFLAIILIINITEAYFKGFIWLTFLLISVLECPRRIETLFPSKLKTLSIKE
jgi:exopolysaccharide production protein ExoQ